MSPERRQFARDLRRRQTRAEEITCAVRAFMARNFGGKSR
jgi:hypothetical protein